MREIGVGIIGTGFMGMSHAMAYRAVAGIFPGSLRPKLEVVADVNAAGAEKAKAQYGFARATTDWKSLINDPAVEIVSITTPNIFHKEMALAAAAAGKHIHCEKPLAPSAADAKDMFDAAEKAGVRTHVGFNYIKNPLLALARDMVAAGELGTVTNFRGIHAEDYMTDPEGPYSWRLDPIGGPGVLADLGSHILSMGKFILGDITELNADLETVVKSRPVSAGSKERKEVLVDDIARVNLRFARGCSGSIEASWVQCGRKMQLGFELSGTKGSLVFNQERFNELHYYKVGSDPRHNGYTKIEMGPQHAPYGNFCVAAGHQLGFNDLKTIEVADFLNGIATGQASGPDFRFAWEIQKIIDTAVASSKARSWKTVG